jgi:hypothetical protein
VRSDDVPQQARGLLGGVYVSVFLLRHHLVERMDLNHLFICIYLTIYINGSELFLLQACAYDVLVGKASVPVDRLPCQLGIYSTTTVYLL